MGDCVQPGNARVKPCADSQTPVCVRFVVTDIIALMKPNPKSTAKPTIHAASITLATVLILMVPLIAMQFTSEVQWSLFDFVLMGALIFAAGAALDVSWQRAGKYKVLAVAGIVLAFLWLWAELAVGIFTNWGS